MSKKKLAWLGAAAVVIVALVAVLAILLPRAGGSRVPDGPSATKVKVDESGMPCQKTHLTVQAKGGADVDEGVQDNCAGVVPLSAPLAKQVLADGKVSQEELQAVKAQYVACLTKAGFSMIYIADDGSNSYMAPANGEKLNQNCTKGDTTGWNYVLFAYMKEHPTPADIAHAGAMTACWKRKGLVPPSYTAEQFMRDSWANSFPQATDGSAGQKCAAEVDGTE